MTKGVGIGPRWITVVERLQWSWSQAGRATLTGGLIGGLIGVGIGVIGGGVDGSFYEAAILGVISGVLFGVPGGVISGLVGGLVSDEIKAHSYPNQGIRRSARYALFSFVGCGGIIGVGFGFPALVAGSGWGLGVALVAGLTFGLNFGLIGGLIGGLSYGGYACLSHFALRLTLYSDRSIPWNYAHFLDYCAERIFIRKVGGGYIFIHRMLMEYFASLDTSQPPEEVSAQPE